MARVKKGSSPKARKTFGVPPRDCPECGKDGHVLDTRVTKNSITRRRGCFKGHRWTSTELYVPDARTGVLSSESLTSELRRQMIDGLISELKAMR